MEFRNTHARDEWQGLGLGSKLVDYIASIAKDMRLEKIYGYVISNNYKMIRLCDKKGFRMETLDEDTVRVSLALS